MALTSHCQHERQGFSLSLSGVVTVTDAGFIPADDDHHALRPMIGRPRHERALTGTRGHCSAISDSESTLQHCSGPGVVRPARSRLCDDPVGRSSSSPKHRDLIPCRPPCLLFFVFLHSKGTNRLRLRIEECRALLRIRMRCVPRLPL